MNELLCGQVWASPVLHNMLCCSGSDLTEANSLEVCKEVCRHTLYCTYLHIKLTKYLGVIHCIFRYNKTSNLLTFFSDLPANVFFITSSLSEQYHK